MVTVFRHQWLLARETEARDTGKSEQRERREGRGKKKKKRREREEERRREV